MPTMRYQKFSKISPPRTSASPTLWPSGTRDPTSGAVEAWSDRLHHNTMYRVPQTTCRSESRHALPDWIRQFVITDQVAHFMQLYRVRYVWCYLQWDPPTREGPACTNPSCFNSLALSLILRGKCKRLAKLLSRAGLLTLQLLEDRAWNI